MKIIEHIWSKITHYIMIVNTYHYLLILLRYIIYGNIVCKIIYSIINRYILYIMLNQFTDKGRYSLMNLFFTKQEGDKTERRELRWEELPEVLRTYFALDVLPDHKPEPMPGR